MKEKNANIWKDTPLYTVFYVGYLQMWNLLYFGHEGFLSCVLVSTSTGFAYDFSTDLLFTGSNLSEFHYLKGQLAILYTGIMKAMYDYMLYNELWKGISRAIRRAKFFISLLVCCKWWWQR